MKCVTALRRRSRPELCLNFASGFHPTKPGPCIRVRRRHNTRGLPEGVVTIADCAAALVASVVTTITVGIRSQCVIVSGSVRFV